MTANVPIERHGHVDQRQDHRLPVLQEEQHDDGHQDDRVAQRLEHLVDRLVDERRRVVDDGVVEARRGSAACSSRHLGLDRVGHVAGRWSRAAGRSPGRPTAGRRGGRSGRSCWAPSSTRATSRRRTTCATCRLLRRPGSVLTMMSPNCSASCSRPSVVIVNWNCWPVGHGRLADLAGGDLHVLLLNGRDHVDRRSGCGTPASAGRARRACCSRAGPGT